MSTRKFESVGKAVFVIWLADGRFPSQRALRVPGGIVHLPEGGPRSHGVGHGGSPRVGVILLSQILNFSLSADGPEANPGSDQAYVTTLPTFAASVSTASWKVIWSIFWMKSMTSPPSWQPKQ